LQVVELKPAERVLWQAVDGPAESNGTTVNWQIEQEGEYTIILFSHVGWKEPVEFMRHCSTKWAVFLMNLKSVLESSTGNPEPRDVKISNWH
jgi:hypothetical protein